ncbi:hypothetical protein LINPERHAP2_LOCUS23216 [Linum perenne]
MLDSKPCRCGTRKKDASSSSAGVAVSPSPITGPRSKLEKQEEQAVNTAPRVSKTEAAAPRIDMYIDLSYIYTNVLLHSTDSDLIFVATRTVLDLKQFIKEWPFIHESEHLLKLLQAIEEALADTYCNMDDVEVAFDDEFRIESSSEIVARVKFRGGTSSGFETATS